MHNTGESIDLNGVRCTEHTTIKSLLIINHIVRCTEHTTIKSLVTIIL